MSRAPNRRGTIGLVLAIDLETAEIDPLLHSSRRLARRCLPLRHFAHTLTGGVVDVVRRFSRAVVDHLRRGSLHPLREVPCHERQVRHARHAAV